jgi:hypothetical protein
MPPKWLVEYWKDEPNWVKRFMNGSFELNASLCGLTVTKDTIWTKSAIRQFLKYMNTIRQTTKKQTILYRGSHVLSPTMNPACFDMKNCQFMSSTRSLSIAKEFAGEKGFVHIFKCGKGVGIYDLEDIYMNDPVKREKEVIIYPGCHLRFSKMIGNKLYWDLTTDMK